MQNNTYNGILESATTVQLVLIVIGKKNFFKAFSSSDDISLDLLTKYDNFYRMYLYLLRTLFRSFSLISTSTI